MDIRKLMDLLENIEKKDSEVEQDIDKDSEDIEVDTDVDDEEKDSEEDSDEDEDEGDDEDSDEDSDDKKITEIGSDLGNGLYGILPVNSLKSFWYEGGNINNNLVDMINGVRKHNLTNSELKSMRRERSVILTVYNKNNDQSFSFVANGLSGKVDFNPSIDSLVSSGIIDKSQLVVVKKLNDLAKKWINSIPDNMKKGSLEMREYKPNTKSWKSSEDKLLHYIENNGYIDSKSTDVFDVIDFSKAYDPNYGKVSDDDPMKPYHIEKAKLMQLRDEADENGDEEKYNYYKKKVAEIFQFIKDKKNENNNIGREKR